MTDQKLTVLIVDDVSETRENIRKLLQFESDIEVVGTANSGREGIQLAQELNPDVVLMDINMPDVDGIVATEEIRKKLPAVQIVILSVQNDQNYMRRAMLAGARDFLTKPPMGDELISAVRRAGEMASQEKAKSPAQQFPSNLLTSAPVSMSAFASTPKGKIITLYSPKGGTGSTTIAVNLALALHNEDTRAVLVDANFQFGDVAVFVNEQGKNTILELAPRVDELDAELVNDTLIKHNASGLSILAAPQKPEDAEKVSPDQFTRVLQFLQNIFSYIIVDTSSILSDALLSTFDISDTIVLVTTQEIPSIKNARLFLDLAQTIGLERGRIVFLVNKFDKRIAITPERIGENLKHEIAVTIPLDEKTVIPSVNRGVPFMLENKAQPAGRGVLSLAEAVRASLKSMETADVVADKR